MTHFSAEYWSTVQSALDAYQKGTVSISNDVDLFVHFFGTEISNQQKQKLVEQVKQWGRSDVLPGLTNTIARLEEQVEAKRSSSRSAAEANKRFANEGTSEAEPDASWFYTQLLPCLVRWAREFPILFPSMQVPVLNQAFVSDPAQNVIQQSVSLTRRQCRCLLSLIFLGLWPSKVADGVEGRDCHVGSASYTHLFMQSMSPVGMHRILCQLLYFEMWRRVDEVTAATAQALQETSDSGAGEDDQAVATAAKAPSSARSAVSSFDNGLVPLELLQPDTILKHDDPVEFVRLSQKVTKCPPWATMDSTPVVGWMSPDAQGEDSHTAERKADMEQSGGIVVSEHLIEQFPGADVHVDFANRQIMIGQIIPSATQEEVMFSIRPELFLTLPLFTTLLDHEAAIVRGSATYTQYTGYLGTFRCTGVIKPEAAQQCFAKPSTVLVMDAHVNMGSQFGTEKNLRDINKAFICFNYLHPTKERFIATGPWAAGPSWVTQGSNSSNSCWPPLAVKEATESFSTTMLSKSALPSTPLPDCCVESRHPSPWSTSGSASIIKPGRRT